MPSDPESTHVGLLRCLHMLADEADSLRLTETYRALRRAMETCRSETGTVRQPGAALH